jgi:short-subunit dehydrogenase
MSTRATHLDKHRFGPWALVTGASSGIGRAFAVQLAANGINLVLAARRLSTLEEVGRELALRHHIQHRSVRVDLVEPDFLNTIVDATDDLPVT